VLKKMVLKPQSQCIGGRIGRRAEEDTGFWLNAKDLEDCFNNGSTKM